MFSEPERLRPVSPRPIEDYTFTAHWPDESKAPSSGRSDGSANTTHTSSEASTSEETGSSDGEGVREYVQTDTSTVSMSDIELDNPWHDMDDIKRCPSSAMTESGAEISEEEVFVDAMEYFECWHHRTMEKGV
jgi:hypothetical protein